MARASKLILLGLVAAGAYYGYTRFLAPHGGQPGMPEGGAPPVEVAEVIAREVREWQDFSGRLAGKCFYLVTHGIQIFTRTVAWWALRGIF